MKKIKTVFAAFAAMALAFTASAFDLGDINPEATAYTAQNNSTLTGTLSTICKIGIPANAVVTLSGVTIDGSTLNSPYNNDDYYHAGLTCFGNATIILEGSNKITSFHRFYPGIHVPEGCTLTIRGSGSLTVMGMYRAAGIGGGSSDGAAKKYGNICIEGGNITAYGYSGAAGIGGGYHGEGGNITITGGTITARGSDANAAGIGGGEGSSCGYIDIRNSAVTATGGSKAAGIGSGYAGSCGDIKIGYGEIVGLNVVATHGSDATDAIGAGLNGTCGTLYKGSSYLSDGTDGATRTIAYWNGDLSTLTGDVVANSGKTITGTLSSRHKVSIAAGVSVTLNNATIEGDYSTTSGFAGLTCLGNAIIQFKGSNTVKGFGQFYPGIHVPVGSKLTMYGSGSLTAGSSSGNYAAGIGAGYRRACGNITLQSGTITAYGGSDAAGIGGAYEANCGNIEITGGTITSRGGGNGAGIGSGEDASCGSIAITRGTVTSTGGSHAAGIGSGGTTSTSASCGAISIGEDIVCVEAVCGYECDNPIGAGVGSTCGSVTVAPILADRTISATRTIEAWKGSLSTLSCDVTIAGTKTITGTLAAGNNPKITIADGATVTLNNVTIIGADDAAYGWAALTCEGDATIILVGNNTVKGFYKYYPGIFVPSGYTLTIRGSGTLDASSNGYGAGIGGGINLDCGNINIIGGTVTATGGYYAAGIGGGYTKSCGNIMIGGTTPDATGGATVTATGGYSAAGIGGGSDLGSSCGTIFITGAETLINATGGTYGAGIGGGNECTNGLITICAGTVTATGGAEAAGIGSGSSGVSGQVSVPTTATFTHITAKCGNRCENPIGAGKDGTCGAQQISNALYDDHGSETRVISSEWPTWNGDLSALTGDMRAADGTVLHGMLGGNYQVYIADGATVTLSNALINADGSLSGAWAGITCLGDATINLLGDNIVTSFHNYYPGIYVPTNKTLIVQGTGSLTASALDVNGSWAAGIGGGYTSGALRLNCGNIVIAGGSVTANGGMRSAGIGSAYRGGCGDITIGAGITRVVATRGFVDTGYEDWVAAIGAGFDGNCGTVTIDASLMDDNGAPTRTIMGRWDGDLSALMCDVTIESDMTLYGELTGQYKISVAAGVTVTLDGAIITNGVTDSRSYSWAGITCQSNATIVLASGSKNFVKGFYADYPGIYVPVGSTLTINGSGSLDVSSRWGAGIGGGYDGIHCGNIVINGGVINAEGGGSAAGIGGAYYGDCGDITINGGTVNATGGGNEGNGTGIGSGQLAKCGDILITGGVVEATGGEHAAGIGSGDQGECGDIVIADGITKVVATHGLFCENAIGAGLDGTCHGIDIDSNLDARLDGATLTIAWNGNLSSLEGSGEVTAVNGTIISGTLASGVNYKVNIADGATVTLSNARIPGSTDDYYHRFAGITCLGDATIILEGTSYVKSFWLFDPGIHVPEGSTLVIRGNGSLTATASNWGSGIGGGYWISCGNIVIEEGTINARGGYYGVGIGGGYRPSGDPITCGNITIGEGVTSVTAIRGDGCAVNPIGAGTGSSNESEVEVTVAGGLINSLSPDGKTRTIARWDGNLATLTDDVIAFDDTVIHGTLGGNYKVSIADGATVTLSNAVINGANGSSLSWAGITCLGDAEIILADGSANTVKGFYAGSSGVYVPVGSTLTIGGNGSLTASSAGDGAGIGAGYTRACGNILIEGGTITATGGSCAAGIGGAYIADCGDITISGGTVDATGGGFGAGIGGGGYGGNCGDITISGGTVTAVGIGYAAGIGGGGSESGDQFESSDCGNITIGFGITSVSATRGSSCDNAIGAGYRGRDYGACGAVSIDPNLSTSDDGATLTILHAAPPPAWDGNLAALTCDAMALDGTVIYGTLTTNVQVSIAAGATVTLSNAVINGENSWDYGWAGITCLGDAEIILADGSANTVKGFASTYPGIYVPVGSTLTIGGNGSLTASSNGDGAGIGAGYEIPCGNITINSGTITATGGSCCAGIGGAYGADCGDITISGGTVDATGDGFGAGIGGGGYGGDCGDITISGGTVTAIAVSSAAGIGGGGSEDGFESSDCGNITIGFGITSVSATRGVNCDNAIGAGYCGLDYGSCGTVTIGSGLYTSVDGATLTISHDAPPVAWAGDLSALTGDVTIESDMTLYGTLGGNYKIYVADGVTVTLDGVTISGVNGYVGGTTPWAGITFQGSATIVLANGSENSVAGFYNGAPGIYVPVGSTLTIQGSGSLTATGRLSAAGIGAGVNAYYSGCGNIVIAGGTITATGGRNAAGIGGGAYTDCGNITIGSGIISVEATHGENCENAIGAGLEGSCDTVTIGSGLYSSEDGATLTISHDAPPVVVWDGDLAALTCDATALDGTVIYGTLGGNYKVSIADGATVTLSNAVINGVNSWDYSWAGITCLGDAEIILADGSANTVKGFNETYSGIYVPVGSTLTIGGNGSLTASSNGDGAGIGAGYTRACGNILIEGGTITATGGNSCAGIGGAYIAACGDITISGGTVYATGGGSSGAGIGCGGYGGDCGDITISGGTVTAIGMSRAAGIGGGGSESGDQFESSDCGNITIGFGITSVSATHGVNCENAIGAGYCGRNYGACGTVTIDPSLYPSVDGATLTLTSTPPPVQCVTIDGTNWYYRVLGGTAEIYNEDEFGRIAAVSPAPSGALEIPATLGGYTVTAIGVGAFAGLGGITSITLPATVSSIGNFAFYGIQSLESVTIPDSVETIGYRAFGFSGLNTLYVGLGRTDEIKEKLTASGHEAEFVNAITFIESVTSDPYLAWAMANDVTGAWNAVGADGVANVFRYIFGMTDFSSTPLITISFDASGNAVITTPEVKNTAGYEVRIKATDDVVDITGNYSTALLEFGDTCKTFIEPEKTKRFFRLVVKKN